MTDGEARDPRLSEVIGKALTCLVAIQAELRSQTAILVRAQAKREGVNESDIQEVADQAFDEALETGLEGIREMTDPQGPYSSRGENG
jgi:hypothetical protein